MKTMLEMLCAAMIVFACHPALAGSDWVVEIAPGAVVANLKADNFSVTGPNGKESLSIFSSIPNVTVGKAFDITDGYVDLKGGAGVLLNSRLGGYMFLGGGGLYIEVKPSILIGPHAYIAYFTEPEWWGDTEIEFSDATGFLAGFHVAAGDRIGYLLSLDYMSAEFDVRDKKNATVSDGQLDMSGLTVMFGIRAQF
jgi:hypothetical protein